VPFARSFLIAFFAALAWFVWMATRQTNGSCFGSGHYVPPAAVALCVVAGLDVALDVFIRSRGDGPPPRRREVFGVVGGAAVATSLTALGLLIGGYFLAVASCSA
jgi:hypothetical protein